jgi:hypothetical protein
MTPAFLQRKHYSSKLFRRNFITPSEMADIIILAKDTTEVAPAKKYRAGTPSSDQRRFLTEMGTVTRHNRQLARAAEPLLTSGPINSALPRA